MKGSLESMHESKKIANFPNSLSARPRTDKPTDRQRPSFGRYLVNLVSYGTLKKVVTYLFFFCFIRAKADFVQSVQVGS